MSENDNITKQEIDEGVALLHGDTVLQFEKPSDQIVEKENGDYAVEKSLGWIKISAAFRKRMLKKLKGAKLAIFICICLHINEDGESFPSIPTICEETGYHPDTVMSEIAEMEGIDNLLKVVRQTGKANRYQPYFAARGNGNEPRLPAMRPPGKSGVVGQPLGQPLDLSSGALKQTPLEKIESKKKEKERRRISFPLSLENQIFAGLPTLTEFEPAKIQDAVTRCFRFNVDWDAAVAKKSTQFTAHKFMEWVAQAGITAKQIEQAAEVYWREKKAGNKDFWWSPSLRTLFTQWPILWGLVEAEQNNTNDDSQLFDHSQIQVR